MRVDFGRLKSCLYMRTTSDAARVTNRSTSSSSRIIARHSLKKCPDPVSAQPQRGVLTFAMTGPLPLRRLDTGADHASVPPRRRGRGVAGRSDNRGVNAIEEAGEGRIDDAPADQV